jgi:hypothetical protein
VSELDVVTQGESAASAWFRCRACGVTLCKERGVGNEDASTLAGGGALRAADHVSERELARRLTIGINNM